jgi:hypothetical protein
MHRFIPRGLTLARLHVSLEFACSSLRLARFSTVLQCASMREFAQPEQGEIQEQLRVIFGIRARQFATLRLLLHVAQISPSALTAGPAPEVLLAAEQPICSARTMKCKDARRRRWKHIP